MFYEHVIGGISEATRMKKHLFFHAPQEGFAVTEKCLLFVSVSMLRMYFVLLLLFCCGKS